MDRDLQTILMRDNPWLLERSKLPTWLRQHLPDPYLPRALSNQMSGRWQTTRRAHLLVGPRQAGKSTTLWAHLAAREAPALHVDCEQALIQRWCGSAPLLLAELEGLVPEPPALLLDEVQHLAEAGLFLKGLVDRGYPQPILVTGSSSFHLGARTRESLAGRATRCRLLPLSLTEVTGESEAAPALLRQRAQADAFERHVVVGGYPEVWLADDPVPLLHDLVEAYALRDASDLFHIARPDAFRRLLHLLAGQIGSLVNLSEWAALLGISRDTVAAYLDILEQSHLVATLRPWVGGKRSELTRRPKAYLLDSGLRNHLVGDLRPLGQRVDRGPLLEGWVLAELAKAVGHDVPLHFWRSTSGAEVDFVIPLHSGLIAVEVKAQALRTARLPRAARSFVEAYHPERLIVVNLGLEWTEHLGSTEIRWVLPWNLVSAVGGVGGAR